MPVLPLVESRMMRWWFSFPERSPSRTMLSAARSFTDPPGLKYSALAQISIPGNSLGMRSRRTSGVFPMVASRGSASVRARCGMGSTYAMITYLDSFSPNQDANIASSCNQRDYRTRDSTILYHHPILCQQSRERRGCGASFTVQRPASYKGENLDAGRH